ncbi:MAG: MBL fold metallo-hydrolase [Pseudomonadales bacterium]|nr:MBL fold metallo-hydrolase [Pseudomonadales bacterium]
MLKEEIYSSENHSWYIFCRDPEKPENIIDTNEYLIISDGEGLAMDPGGTEIFAHVVSAFSEVIPVSDISTFFASHQDPDVISSLPLWTGLCPKAKIYLPWLWEDYIAHFDLAAVKQFVTVPDEGSEIRFRNGHIIQLIPAHYVHAPGNYSLYDPSAKMLFSGDIGSALLPNSNYSVFVEDFEQHISYMETFHKRWMPSNRAKNDWIARVRELEVDMLCPQHGAIFKGEMVGKFLDWFEALEVGIAIPS